MTSVLKHSSLQERRYSGGESTPAVDDDQLVEACQAQPLEAGQAQPLAAGPPGPASMAGCQGMMPAPCCRVRVCHRADRWLMQCATMLPLQERVAAFA